jgi:hypothetical protein
VSVIRLAAEPNDREGKESCHDEKNGGADTQHQNREAVDRFGWRCLGIENITDRVICLRKCNYSHRAPKSRKSKGTLHIKNAVSAGLL